jgi:hypothetical protein
MVKRNLFPTTRMKGANFDWRTDSRLSDVHTSFMQSGFGQLDWKTGV